MTLQEVYAELSKPIIPSPTTAWLADKNMARVCPIGGWASLDWGRNALTGGGGGLSLMPEAEAAQVLLTRDPDESYFVVIETDGYRWVGRAQEPELNGKNGVLMMDCDLEDIWQVPAGIACLRNPANAVTAQSGSAVTVTGKVATIARSTLAANLTRLGLTTQVQQVPLASDSSPSVTVTLNYRTFGETFNEVFKRYGVYMDVWMWLPGDPAVAGLSLSAPTILVDIKPSGAFQGMVDAAPGSPIAQLGTTPTWVQWRLDGPGVSDFTVGVSRAQAHTVIFAPSSSSGSFTLLADATRKAKMGSFAPPEVFATSKDATSAAVVLEKAGGHYSLVVNTIPGVPHVFGRSFVIGTPVVFQLPPPLQNKRMYSVCTDVKYSSSEGKPDVLAFGYGFPDMESSTEIVMAKLASLESWSVFEEVNL